MEPIHNESYLLTLNMTRSRTRLFYRQSKLQRPQNFPVSKHCWTEIINWVAEEDKNSLHLFCVNEMSLLQLLSCEEMAAFVYRIYKRPLVKLPKIRMSISLFFVLNDRLNDSWINERNYKRSTKWTEQKVVLPLSFRNWSEFTNVYCWKSKTQSTTEVPRTSTRSSSPSKRGAIWICSLFTTVKLSTSRL